jgi:hypothetical protein
MRPVLVVCALGVLSLAVALTFSVARAAPEDEASALDRIGALEQQVRLLQDEVAYLLAREEALTRAAVAADPAARTFVAGLATARREGFEAAAFPAPARATLMRSLEGLARDLSAATPVPSAEHARLVRDLAVRRRALLASR